MQFFVKLGQLGRVIPFDVLGQALELCSVGGYVGGLCQDFKGFFAGDFEVRVAIQSSEGLCEGFEVCDFLGSFVACRCFHEVELKSRKCFFSEESAHVDDLKRFRIVGGWLFQKFKSAFGQKVEEFKAVPRERFEVREFEFNDA